MEWVKIVGISALALMGAAWLYVSFHAPGRTRSVVEWVAATCLYVALLSFFVFLVDRALTEGQTVGVIAFGFLALMFAAGACVSGYRIVRELRGRSGPSGGAATQ